MNEIFEYWEVGGVFRGEDDRCLLLVLEHTVWGISDLSDVYTALIFILFLLDKTEHC